MEDKEKQCEKDAGRETTEWQEGNGGRIGVPGVVR